MSSRVSLLVKFRGAPVLLFCALCASCGSQAPRSAPDATGAAGAAGTPGDAGGQPDAGGGTPDVRAPADVATPVPEVGGGTDAPRDATADAGDAVQAGDAPAERPALPGVVDATTLDRKMLFGYQGWFLAPGDGSPVNAWTHWFRNGTPTAANLTFDLWPDTSELGADELYPTQLKNGDGSAAALYSAYNAKTVARHTAWMKAAGIDGVAVQRFLAELQDQRFFAVRNRVAENVRAGAEANGRVFAIEYDITSTPEANLTAWLQNDWKYLVDTLKITASDRYLRDGGKPVLFLWGLGFSDRPGTAAQVQGLIDWFTKTAGPQYVVTLVGGVPTHWRTLDGDSKTDAAWGPVYRSLDVISPWIVGRFGDDAGADNYKNNTLVADLAAAKAAGKRYMVGAFPGFSWHNLMASAPSNQIPRRGGRFYWRQVWNALSAGATLMKTAMFDEVDEGTAMFKLAPTAARQPVGATFVPLDADGEALPSDFYLRLGGAATRALRGELPLSATVPIAP
jgi:hypothetical protein